MTEQEFHTKRQALYLDEDLTIKLATGRYANVSHAKWFSEIGYPYVHTVRGYYIETEDDCFVMLYWNDFEVPNINAAAFAYFFEYFPKIKWIGLGCNKGKIGEIWTPKFKIYKGGL